MHTYPLLGRANKMTLHGWMHRQCFSMLFRKSTKTFYPSLIMLPHLHVVSDFVCHIGPVDTSEMASLISLYVLFQAI